MWLINKKRSSKNTFRKRRAVGQIAAYTVQARASDRRSERLHRVGVVFLLIAGLSGLAWLSARGAHQVKRWLFADNHEFVINHIDASSTGRLTPAHLVEFGGLARGVNLFELDLEDVRAKLSMIPVVQDASVQRQLPDKLIIRVNERIPVARIAHGRGGFYFSVDQSARVLGLAGPPLSSLPVILGIRDMGISPGVVLEDHGVMDALQLIAFSGQSPLGELVRIKSVDVANPELLDMLLETGVRVLLPRKVTMRKLEDLVLILRESGGRLSFIDLTFDRNIPVT